MKHLALSAGLVLGVLAVAAAPAAGPARKPNIVVIVADDLGYAELGCQGCPDVPTPHIDSLAKNGVRCTQGYVTAPVCCPSRAGLITGRLQTRFGHEHNAIGRQNLDERVGLPTGEVTLAQVLKSAGYATGLVGKWHLGAAAKYHPQRRGFDEFFGFLHEGHFYVPPPYEGVLSFLRKRDLPDGSGGRRREGNVIFSSHLNSDEPPYDADNPLLRGTKPVAEPAYLTDAFGREATDFIRRHRAEPFFLHLAFNAPHSPMQAPETALARFRHIPDEHRRIFAAMVSRLDDAVGTVLTKLREAGLEEQTLIFFLSDNGGPTQELTSSNRPLRGGKGQLYEGGIRVPFLVQWKGRLPAGRVYEQPVSALDVFATAAAATGAKPAADRPLDGVDLVPYLTGRQGGTPHPSLFWRYGQAMALRQGDWKLVRQPLRRGKGPESFQLFDLATDPAEETDLAAGRPEVVRGLRAALERWDAQMVAPLWQPGRPAAKPDKP